MRNRQGLGAGRGLVIAHHPGDGLQKNALAVGARAVQEKQRVLVRVPGEPVSDDAGEVGLAIVVALGDAGEDVAPHRAVAVGRDGRRPRALLLGGGGRHRAGFPRLAGFFVWYFVAAAAVDVRLTWLALIGVLASVVSGYYYLRVLVAFWMKNPEDAPASVQSEAFPVPLFTKVVLVACVVALLVLGIVPGMVTEVAGAFFPISESAAVLP